MSELLARCFWLKAKLVKLMGESGRRHSVFDEGDMPRRPEGGWQSLGAWAAAQPPAWHAFVLDRCEPLRDAVRAVNALRAELAKPRWASQALRGSLYTYYERGVVAQPLLVGVEDGETWTSYRTGKPSPVEEVVLVTAPASVADLNGLIALARDVALDEEQRTDEIDALFEAAPCDDPPKASRAPSDTDERILKALCGRALTADALAAATDCSRRNIIRRIKEHLEPAGLVKNVSGLGYYRTDRPSREVKQFLNQPRGVTKSSP
jgi:hypothetical protein